MNSVDHNLKNQHSVSTRPLPEHSRPMIVVLLCPLLHDNCGALVPHLGLDGAMVQSQRPGSSQQKLLLMGAG